MFIQLRTLPIASDSQANTSLHLNIAIYMLEPTYSELNSPSLSHSKPALLPVFLTSLTITISY